MPNAANRFSLFTLGKNWYDAKRNSPKIKPFGPSVLTDAYLIWEKLNDQIPQEALQMAVLHNDPNLRNIIWHNAHITFLDWEVAGIENPHKEIAHICAWMGLNDQFTNLFLSAYYDREPTVQELFVIETVRKIILLEFAWIGLSSLEAGTQLNQTTWDQLYEQASPKKLDTLSILQMSSTEQPSEETIRNIFLGFIKQFMIET